MRHILTILVAGVICTAQATVHNEAGFLLSKDTLSKDTVEKKWQVTLEKKDTDDKIKYPRTFGGITFSRIDWGFSRPMDNGSFTMSEQNQFLSYGRASNFGFDVLQFGVRFNDAFRIYASTGFEWNYMRLKNNVLLVRDKTPLDFVEVDPDEIHFKKNILTSTYLRIPLTVEWRGPRTQGGKRLRIAAGPMTGILLKGTQRLKSDQQGKQRFRDNFNLQSFQYGGFIRVGYGQLGMFAKYYMNDMFEKSPAQEGFKNFAFGLTLGF